MQHMDEEQPLTAEERRELEEYRRKFGPLENWAGEIGGKHLPEPPETRHIAQPQETKRKKRRGD